MRYQHQNYSLESSSKWKTLLDFISEISWAIILWSESINPANVLFFFCFFLLQNNHNCNFKRISFTKKRLNYHLLKIKLEVTYFCITISDKTFLLSIITVQNRYHSLHWKKKLLKFNESVYKASLKFYGCKLLCNLKYLGIFAKI